MDMKKGKFAMSVLEIKDLHVEIEGKKILKGVNLTLKTGEIAAIMGPNGTGKSTLSAAIMGNPNYEVTEGEVLFDGVNILELDVDERARMGLFLAMQYPSCLLYTSDAADDLLCVDLGGCRILKKKKKESTGAD